MKRSSSAADTVAAGVEPVAAKPSRKRAAPARKAAAQQEQPQQAQALPPQAAPAADTATSPAADGAALSREERIRRAAYARYEQRNGAGGDETTDWLEAEAQLNRTDPHPAVWAP